MNEKRKRSRRWESFKRVTKSSNAKIGLFIIILFLLTAAMAPLLAPYDPDEQDLSITLQFPSLQHPLGTDEFGRDILSRIVYGARPTFVIVLTATGIGLVVGGGLGLISGYQGGKIDSVIMRFLDVLLAFPGILLALAIISGIGPGMKGVIIATSIYSIPQLARVARASVLVVKENDYIMAARATGEGTWSVISRYILPNAIMPILSLAFLRMGMIIIIAASLSFLGVGIQPPMAEWGIMLSQGRSYLRIAPFLPIFPGLALVTVVLGFNLLGDGLRDALDPKYQRED
jgi:ABC-type dipeptide/oligopeptide/nickel transport system permease subunit